MGSGIDCASADPPSQLEAPNHPPITFAFHDNQTIRPSTVKDILCNQVGLAEQDALALL
jgi:hypothetical protein